MGVFPILQIGFYDSVASPGALSSILLFAIFLIFMTSKGAPLVLSGGLFLASMIITNAILNMGIIYPILHTRAVEVFWDIGYFIIAFCEVIAGIIFFRDWWLYKRTKDIKFLVFKFSFLDPLYRGKNRTLNENWGNRFKFLFFCVVSISSGLMVCILAAAWPPQALMGRLFYNFISLGFVWSAILPFLFYAVAYVTPLMITLLLVCLVVSSDDTCAQLKKHFAILQVCCSAICLSFGCVLLLYYR